MNAQAGKPHGGATGAGKRRWPAIFFGHGSPMNTLDDNAHTRAWRSLGQAAGRPQAILAISAHWYVDALAVTAMPSPRTIHDFYGFPPQLHAFDYPAPGSPALAERVATMLEAAGEGPVLRDRGQWGLDHGTWSVLAHAYPRADVPVVQLSLDARRSGDEHVQLARVLAPLRDEGVLIVGSGNVVHNLRLLQRAGGAAPYPWAASFEQWAIERLQQHDLAALADPWSQQGEAAKLSIPTPEHYWPLVYVAALREAAGEEPLLIASQGIEAASISMLSFAVGAAQA
jgi:4,5-DOPA dioxygenase extradiol